MIVVEQPDKEEVERLSAAIDKLAYARQTFVEFMSRKYNADSSQYAYSVKEGRFVNKENQNGESS